MRRPLGPTLAAVGLAGLAGTIVACAHYAPAPLDGAADVLKAPDREILAARASTFSHPRLRPVRIDFGQPLTPDALGVIAVVANPDLKAARAKAGVADAQVFAAGLLPDPQVNLSYDDRLSGPDAFNGWAAGFIYELNAFRTRRATLAIERAARDQTHLDLAWQEWQTAGQARLLAVRIQGLERAVTLNRRTRTAAEATLAVVLEVSARGDLKGDEVSARRIAAAESADRTRLSERDLGAARLDLTKLLGLAPGATVAIAPISPSTAPLPDTEELFQRARTNRLDILALQAGYRSQEASVRKAVMDQFPSLQLTVARAQDTADNQTIGPAFNFTLPLFNRNRGGIALAKATREQLQAEYAARLFTARADIGELVEQLALEARQRAEIAAQVTPLDRLVAKAETSAARGDISRVVAEAARQSLTDKEITLGALDQAMAEQRITLELAVGALLPEIAG